MGISNKLNEGRIYRLLQTAIKMRSLQRQRGKVVFNEKEVHDLEVIFDAQLDAVLKDVDKVDTDRVIMAKENFS